MGVPKSKRRHTQESAELASRRNPSARGDWGRFKTGLQACRPSSGCKLATAARVARLVSRRGGGGGSAVRCSGF